MLRIFSFIILVLSYMSLHAQKQLPFYPNGVPNVRDGINLGTNQPKLYFYKPHKQINDKVFLILPGGGYGKMAIHHEGYDVAERLKDLGYTSFVLRYRLPIESQMVDKRIAPIQDAQSALAYIHQNAKRLGVDIKDVVVVGFSAGGHLASTLSTHHHISYIGDIDKKLLRPDYSVLVYPVITMRDGITHSGSRVNLIGPHLFETDVLRFSNEKNVNESTPPAFIVHSDDDKTVSIENATLYQEALEQHKIKNKFYRYKKGIHGFGMYNEQEDGDWFEEMLKWVNEN